METRSGRASTDEEYKLRFLSDSTSEFRQKDIDTLNILFADCGAPDDIVVQKQDHIPSFLFIRDYNKYQIQSIADIGTSALDTEEKTLVDLIQRVVQNEDVKIGTKESLTDTFVDFLLRKLGFESYPLRLNIKPIYVTRIGRRTVTSECDFSVERNKSVLMIEEDKHLKNTYRSERFGEFQIAGELLAAASENYQNDPKDQIIYGMRAIGTRFTFYKAFFSERYLYSLPDGIPNEVATIYRYSKGTERGYDYAEPQHRQDILAMLSSLKDTF